MATRSSFYGQISANKRNSFLLAAFVVAIFAVLGFTIGYAIVGDAGGWRRCDWRWRWGRLDHRRRARISAATSSS